jgi:hypothetical protein
MKLCECGCGTEINDDRRCANGHGNKIIKEKWDKEKIIKKVQEIFKIQQLKKRDFWDFYNLYGLPSMNVITRLFGNLDNLAKEANILFAKRNRRQYLIEHPEVKEKILKHNSIFHKEKKYEQRYGNEKSINIRKKMSISRIGKVPFNKNKHNKELFGLEKANYLTEQNRKQATKYSEEDIIKSLQNLFIKYNNIAKIDLEKYYKTKEFCCHPETIRIKFDSLDNLAKLARVKFTKPIIIFSNKFNRKKGANEEMILDFYEQLYKLKLERHAIIFTKKTFRFPDSINHQNKTIYEIDEEHHFANTKQFIEDREREKEILEIYPDYKFVRIKEKEFLDKYKNELEIFRNKK